MAQLSTCNKCKGFVRSDSKAVRTAMQTSPACRRGDCARFGLLGGRSAAARSLSHSWPVTAVLTPIAERLPRTWAVRGGRWLEMAEPPTVAAAKQTLRRRPTAGEFRLAGLLAGGVAMSHVLGLIEVHVGQTLDANGVRRVVMST